jgi:hypothetical protein
MGWAVGYGEGGQFGFDVPQAKVRRGGVEQKERRGKGATGIEPGTAIYRPQRDQRPYMAVQRSFNKYVSSKI